MDSNTKLPNKFLAFIANDLLKTHKQNLHLVTIVFPNRRAGLFLEKALKKQISQPIWLPTTLGLDNFLQNYFNQKYSTELEQKVALFNCYKQVYGEGNKSLQEFLKFSSALLSDFNDILESSVSTEDLLKNLLEIKKIEHWDTENPNREKLKAEFLIFWQKLPKLYDSYLQLFKNKTLFNRSYAENQLANQLKEKKAQFNHPIVFAGFNALSEAELEIMGQLKNQFSAQFYFDIDAYYFNNPVHQAAKPLKNVLKKLKIETPNWIHNSIHETPKQIEIHGAPGNFYQLKLAGNLLKNIPEHEQKKTAVILCNPNLAIDFLSAIPQNISALNISIGFPIKTHYLFKLYEQLTQLFYQIAKQKQNGKILYIKYSDLQKITENEIIKNFANADELKQIEAFFKNFHHTFINADLLSQLQSQINVQSTITKVLIQWINSLFSKDESWHQFKDFFDLFDTIFSQNEVDVLTREIHLLLKTEIISIDDQIEKLKIAKTAENFHALFVYLLQNLNIDLIGEPLEGLQVIGLLETRNLDFDHLIFISVNEGVLPSPKNTDSLIPYDVRKAYNLPTYEQHDGIFSYHFYRAIQRAKNVTLIYNALTDDFGKGEKSRFIYQIENESAFKQYIVSNKIHQLNIPSITQKPLQVKTNQEEKESLIQYLTKSGLSPSAFNTYHLNPIEFYFRYVLGIKEEKEYTETLNPAELGDVIHQILQDFYSSIEKHPDNSAYLKECIKKIKPEVEKAFFQKFNRTNNFSGKTILLKNITSQLIVKVLLHDIQNPNFKVYKLEEELIHHLKVEGNEIKLKGKADRIDVFEDTLRVIDYKTGYVDEKELNISSVEALFNEEFNPKAMQLMFYAYLTSIAEKKLALPIQSCIFSTSKSKELHYLQINKSKEIKPEYFIEFEKLLIQNIEKILEGNDFMEPEKPKYPAFFKV